MQAEREKMIAAEVNEHIVEIQNLHKSFAHCEVLKGVSLLVNKGENLVVLGKSGSGKSVLIKCIVGLMEPDEGLVKVFGRDISGLNYKALNAMRTKIGFLFQGAALYDSMTVGENLSFPLKHHFKKMSRSERSNRISETLDSVGLAEAIDKMPSELSGGMSKRVGLARSLILNPEIMLYDEPTTGLDTVTAREISELIVTLQKKNRISSIIITHDMACAKLTADRIILLKDGQITAQGSYEALAASEDDWVKSFFY